MEPYNQLSPAQAERLAILTEELAEAAQVVGKILRHGYNSYNPFSENPDTNRQLLEEELGHVLNAMNMLVNAEDINSKSIAHSRDHKSKTVHKWTHHQEDEQHGT
jgi:NTP pyrophosphatase (non-canonical NTP hydrolase)